MTPSEEGSELNPAQQEILDELGSTQRPRFRDDLRDHLRHQLETELAALLAESVIEADPSQPLYVSKHRLSSVHGCEARHLAEDAIPFEWTVASARGTVTHKAIELLVGSRSKPTPLDLVDQALARLENEERSIAAFLASLDEGDRAALVTAVNDLVAGFIDAFPPLKRQWAPVAESRARAEFCGGRVVLSGSVDLTLGRARGPQAGKVLIDLKTGRPIPSHVDDLRFYALLETLKLGVPPRLVVSYYLDAGAPRTETVTEDLLWATQVRVVDAVAKIVRLAGGDEPSRQVGPPCRWCPVSAGCESGQAFLAEDQDDPWRP